LVPLALFGVLATCASIASAQAIEQTGDSVQIRVTDADIGGVIQGFGRYLRKPIVVANIPDARIPFFETPAPVHRDELPRLLWALLQAYGLELIEEAEFFRVAAVPDTVSPTPAPEPVPQDSLVQLFAVRLKHARSADVAAALNQLYGSGGQFSAPAGLSSSGLSEALRANREGTREPTAEPTQQRSAELTGAIVIVPDPMTNSLLIRASAADFAVLDQAIQVLDVRPGQVLVEVIVVEARKDRQFSLGFDLFVPPQPLGVDDATIEGGLFGAGLGDLVVRVMNLGRADINITLSAARLRGDIEILSRPVILASNNTEASLLVGTQRPFVQVSRSLPTELPQRDQVIQYRDVGTKLTVLPSINAEGYISLLLRQEISAATGETQFGAPIISSREASTQVLVEDGKTIVIGGLRDQVHEYVRTGVPLLADIPLLGALFGSTRVRDSETELFLFITPMIVTDDANGLSESPGEQADGPGVDAAPGSPNATAAGRPGAGGS
jgi:general secretion pathway protein D